MNRLCWTIVALGMICLAGCAVENVVMGVWKGKIVGQDKVERPISAQVVADGGEKYHAVVKLSDDKEVILQGQTEGDRTIFAPEGGEAQRGEVRGGCFAGEWDGGAFKMSRVEKKSPTLGASPPEGAIVLFDGTNLDEWTHPEDRAPEWKLVDGAMEVVSAPRPPKGDSKKKLNNSLYTKRNFRDFHMHLEFCCPFMPDKRDQARGNSGVYLPDGSEIQVLDSFGKKPAWNECGGIYKQATPLVDAEFPPGTWQTYDVDFTAPVLDEKRNVVRKAGITVRQNGLLIHDNFEPERKGQPEGPIMLQDHGNPVRYRNIWVVPKDN